MKKKYMAACICECTPTNPANLSCREIESSESNEHFTNMFFTRNCFTLYATTSGEQGLSPGGWVCKGWRWGELLFTKSAKHVQYCMIMHEGCSKNNTTKAIKFERIYLWHIFYIHQTILTLQEWRKNEKNGITNKSSYIKYYIHRSCVCLNEHGCICSPKQLKYFCLPSTGYLLWMRSGFTMEVGKKKSLESRQKWTSVISTLQLFQPRQKSLYVSKS